MNKKLLGLSRLLSVVLLISTFLLISACIKIVQVTPTSAPANTTFSTSTTIPNYYTLTIQTTGQGSESASPGQTTYASGTVVYLTATPATGWTFSDWSGSDDIANTTSNSTTITINGNESVTATFIQSNYILNTSVIGNGSIGLNNNGPYHYGDVVQLTATPAAGWSFANWSGDVASSTTATTVITINSDTNVIANFVAIRYSLSTSVSPSGGGSVSPSNGSYAYGSIVTLTATPASGYQFSSWSGDISSANQTVPVTMYSNKNVTANFTKAGPEQIQYNMPPGAVSTSWVSYTNYLSSGVEIRGTVSLTGYTALLMDWSNTWYFEIYDPSGNLAYQKSYTFSSGSVNNFDFITNQPGAWKIKVSHWSLYSRTLQITISPSGW